MWGEDFKGVVGQFRKLYCCCCCCFLGSPHSISDYSIFFFVDGLKEFRKAHDINDSVIIRFFALDKNTSFEVEVMGPIRGQSRGRSVVTTRRHVFTTDVTQDMVQHNLPLVGVSNPVNYVVVFLYQLFLNTIKLMY